MEPRYSELTDGNVVYVLVIPIWNIFKKCTGWLDNIWSFRCKKNTWHVESDYISQPPKYLIIVVNRFRYINNNFTKDRCSIPMDMTVILGLHKFSLQATINHHGPSMYSGHYTASINCCKKKFIATTAKLRSLKWLIPKTPLLLMW